MADCAGLFQLVTLKASRGQSEQQASDLQEELDEFKVWKDKVCFLGNTGMKGKFVLFESTLQMALRQAKKAMDGKCLNQLTYDALTEGEVLDSCDQFHSKQQWP